MGASLRGCDRIFELMILRLRDRECAQDARVCFVSQAIRALRERGGRAASYTEEQGKRIMKPAEISMTVTLGRGVETATVWTCDLSYDYVKINADYRS